MKNNWTKAVNEVNRNKYTIPEGWDTKEQVAESLQCAPDRVADLLKPGLQAGEFERQEFPVWDEARRMTVRVVCYRQKPTAEPGEDKERERVLRALERHPTENDRGIARRAHSTVKRVAEIRKEAGK